jgi:hypothetical protein
MKTLFRPFFFILLALSGAAGLQAQTADEVVSKYVDAIGGKKAISAVTSLVIESNVNVMGSDAPSTTQILVGKGFKSETDFNGSKIVNCVTDKGGWAMNPFAGQTSPTPIPDAQFKATRGSLWIGGPLVDYSSKGYKLELAGKEATDYKLKLTSDGGVNIYYYINTGTYLIDKMVNSLSVNGQDMEITTAFSDYRKTETGFLMPFKQDVTYPQRTVAITHNKIEVNKAVDPTIFEMPK